MAVRGFGGGKRGCGYPQVGGLYLVSEPLAAPCDRLPMEIPKCPVCGETVRFSRSMQEINPLKLFGEHEGCKDAKVLRPCPVCQPNEGPAGLMWAGKAYYSPESFCKEARDMGISKRINTLPKFFEVGKTWMFIAHKEACKGWAKAKEGGDEILVPKPGILLAVKPSRLEKVMKKSDITEEKVKELEERGIDILEVPDDDDRFTTPYKPTKGRSHPMSSAMQADS